jgi:hypothetical protein
MKVGQGFSTTVTYQRPDTIKTRLGSIPADYETSSGWEKVERIYFQDDHREAANPYGRSQEIWRNQPTYSPDGQPKMSEVSETIVGQPHSKAKYGLAWGAAGAALGGIVGAILGNAGAGAMAGGAALGLAGVAYAAGDKVRLEWQETPIQEHTLIGYRYEVDEDTSTDSDGNTTTDDYEHEFRPILESKTVGQYQQPVVVHYRD